MRKHFGPRPRIKGRPRLLDSAKKVELCQHVAKGATVEEAAETVCISLRTVQRERKLDEDFDHELQLSLTSAPDPLKMMQHAARSHWRAAAWLLERTDPEQYARRAKNSASPAQFEAGLQFVMEAALAAIPPELHEAVYGCMTAAAEEAFVCLFPNFGRWGDAKRPKLPPTPLVQEQWRQRHANPQHRRVIAENDLGRIEECTPPNLPAHLQPRALPGGRSPSAVGWVDRAAATHQGSATRFPNGPRTTPYPSALRLPDVSHDDHPHLSPKTRITTIHTPNDQPPNNAPITALTVGVFDLEAQTRRERVPDQNARSNLILPSCIPPAWSAESRCT